MTAIVFFVCAVAMGMWIDSLNRKSKEIENERQYKLGYLKGVMESRQMDGMTNQEVWSKGIMTRGVQS